MDPRIIHARRTGVRQAVEQIRQRLTGRPIDRVALAGAEPVLAELSRRADWFPLADFPLHPEFDGVIYRLAEDADHGFALFASVGRPGKARNIHNHTTWAVIAGVHGVEHNSVFERVDDGTDPGQGRLRKLLDKTVSPGGAVSMLGEDYHCISVDGSSNSLHLHMYGMSHAYLAERTGFLSPEGGAVVRYPRSYSIGLLAPDDLRSMLDDGQEIAVIDVREEGAFGRDGHLLLSGNLPYSHLETLAPDRLPRKSVRLVVCDADDGLAQRAAIVLMKSGYSNVHVLEGGTPAWRTAGHRLYGGLNVASKALAEVVAHRTDTPQITASTLKAWRDAGTPHRLVDCRPGTEFQAMNVPGALLASGYDLVRKAHDLSADERTPIVISCAGRTRSLMSLHSLRVAGIRQPAYALQGGTMGWTLAGYDLETGSEPPDLTLSPAARAAGSAITATLRSSGRFATLSRAAMDDWLKDDQRTTYVIDVRGEAEFRAAHVPAARHLAGAQLVHTADARLPVQHARVVVCDDDGVRACMTAYWLSTLGLHDVAVLDGLSGGAWTTGEPPRSLLRQSKSAVNLIDATATAAGLAAGSHTVVDLSGSLAYRDGHIPGAWHAIRSRLAENLSGVGGTGAIVLTSEDGLRAWLACAEAESATDRPVFALVGGNAAWRQAGLPWETGAARWAGDQDDVWLRAHQQTGDKAKAMRDYLQWELDLVQSVESDADFRFRDRVTAIG